MLPGVSDSWSGSGSGSGSESAGGGVSHNTKPICIILYIYIIVTPLIRCAVSYKHLLNHKRLSVPADTTTWTTSYPSGFPQGSAHVAPPSRNTIKWRIIRILS